MKIYYTAKNVTTGQVIDGEANLITFGTLTEQACSEKVLKSFARKLQCTISQKASRGYRFGREVKSGVNWHDEYMLEYWCNDFSRRNVL